MLVCVPNVQEGNKMDNERDTTKLSSEELDQFIKELKKELSDIQTQKDILKGNHVFYR